MIGPLILAVLWPGGPLRLPVADRLSIYAKALHYEASQVTGRVDQYTVSAYAYGENSQEGETKEVFARLKPLLANLPVPVVEDAAADSRYRASLYATISDVVDRNHAVVETSHYRNDSEHSGGRRFVMARENGGWKVAQPKLSAADEKAIQQAAFIFLLSHRDYGYTKGPAYVGLIDEDWKSTVSLGWHPARDPDPATMQALWRRSWSLKYISETPEGRGYSKPRQEFGVGDIQPIDPHRALIHLVSNHWNMEPGYNQDFGPEGANEATYLATRKGKSWRMSGIRGFWYLVPAE